MSPGLTNFIAFLLQIIFQCYIFLLLLRLLLQFFHANFLNQLAQFIIKSTKFIVRPAQQLFPVYRSFNSAVAILIVLLKYIQVNLIVWLRYDNFPNQFGILLWVVGSLMMTVCNIWFYALFLRIIFNWLGTTFENIYYEITFSLTEPLLKPIRHYLPQIGVFDFSPLVLAILLQFIMVLVLAPVLQTAQSLALGGLLGTN